MLNPTGAIRWDESSHGVSVYRYIIAYLKCIKHRISDSPGLKAHCSTMEMWTKTKWWIFPSAYMPSFEDLRSNTQPLFRRSSFTDLPWHHNIHLSGLCTSPSILLLLVAFQQSTAWINSSKEALFKRSVQHPLLTSATLIQLSDKMIKANCTILRLKKSKRQQPSLFYPYSFPTHMLGRTPPTWQKCFVSAGSWESWDQALIKVELSGSLCVCVLSDHRPNGHNLLYKQGTKG